MLAKGTLGVHLVQFDPWSEDLLVLYLKASEAKVINLHILNLNSIALFLSVFTKEVCSRLGDLQWTQPR